MDQAQHQYGGGCAVCMNAINRYKLFYALRSVLSLELTRMLENKLRLCSVRIIRIT